MSLDECSIVCECKCVPKFTLLCMFVSVHTCIRILSIVFKCVSMAVACMCVEGMTTNECEHMCIDKGR